MSNVATPSRVYRRLVATEHELRLQASLAHHVSRPAAAELEAGTYREERTVAAWEDFQMNQAEYLKTLVTIRDLLLVYFRNGLMPEEDYIELRKRHLQLRHAQPVRTVLRIPFGKSRSTRSQLSQRREVSTSNSQRQVDLAGLRPAEEVTPATRSISGSGRAWSLTRYSGAAEPGTW